MEPQARRHRMRYGVPTLHYLEFVARELLKNDALRVDPFMLDVPDDKLEDAYVIREPVVQTLRPGQSTITMGAEGCGKTMLFRKAVALRDAGSLIVKLPLVGSFPVDGAPPAEPVRPLAPDAIARLIFNAYWEATLRDISRRAAYLDIFRKDAWWMARLRWFYRVMRPLHPDLPDEFELLTWLRAKPSSPVFSAHINSEARLREVVSFVTADPPAQFGGSGAKPYTKVHVFIDGIDHLPDSCLAQLLDDFVWLHELRTENLSFTLFAGSERKERICAISAVSQGRIPIQDLPTWTKPELEELLLRRLIAWRGQDETWDPHPQFDWTQWLPSGALEPQARTQFISTIIEGCTPPLSSAADPLDAPIHALHLARALLTEVAEARVTASGSFPGLNLKQIKDLVGVYWGA